MWSLVKREKVTVSKTISSLEAEFSLIEKGFKKRRKGPKRTRFGPYQAIS